MHPSTPLTAPNLIGVPLLSLNPLRAPARPGHKYRPFYTSQTLQPIPFFLTSPFPTPNPLPDPFLVQSPYALGGFDDSPTSVALDRRLLHDDYLLAEMEFGEEVWQAGIACMMGGPQFQAGDGRVESTNPFATDSAPRDDVAESATCFVTDGGVQGGRQGAYVPPPSAEGAPEISHNQLLAVDTTGRQTLLPSETDNEIQEEIEVEGRPLDGRFLSPPQVYHHDPQRPLPTTREILQRLAKFMSSGITKKELRQLLRKCKSCHRFMYADSRAHHRCHQAHLKAVNDPTFDLESAFLSSDEHGGWPKNDVIYLLKVCNRCDRIVLSAQLASHMCP